MATALLATLAAELAGWRDELAASALALGEGSPEAAERYLEPIERLARAGEVLDIPALGDLAMFVMANVPDAVGDSARATLLAHWPDRVERFFAAPGPDTRADLEALLRAPGWPTPLDAGQGSVLIDQLLDADRAATQEVSGALRSFDAADTSLAFADELQPDLARAFVSEGPAQAAQLAAVLGVIASGAGDDDAVNNALRLAHTLKGSAALVGVRAIATLSHVLEDLLQALSRGAVLPEPARELLGVAGDSLEAMFDALGGRDSAPDDVLALFEALAITTAALDDPVSHPSVPAPAPVVATELRTAAASANVDIVASVPSASATPQPAALAPSLVVPLSRVDEMLRLVGELGLGVAQIEAQLRAQLQRSDRLGEQLRTVQQHLFELETQVDVHGVPARPSRFGVDAIGAGVVPAIDPLELDQYNALHSISRGLGEAALDSREMARDLQDELLSLQNRLAQHARATRELNSAVLAARVVPIATIVPRLRRIVRQACQTSGKHADLEVSGAELSLDTDILDGLVEPLLHALRNAVDHGIEPAEQRRAAGKPAHGRIAVKFRRDGNAIDVRVRDDGGGLDRAAITARAVARGMLAGTATPDDAALVRLLFQPGFSTRSEVTHLSGRGIGLDAIRAAAQRLKGTCTLADNAGQGCELRLRLPLTLMTTHALLVAVGDSVLALPSLMVEQVLFGDAGRIGEIAGARVFHYGTSVYPLQSLAELLGERDRDETDAAERPLVLARGDDGLVALLFDRALDSRELVVKSLEPLLPGLRGVTGAALLPDGALAMVLDLRELLRTPVPHFAADTSAAARVPRRRRVLVVDDSLSARRSLVQLLEDSGFAADGAVDGVDALDCIGRDPPDLLLVDLEMPRMNGLELAAHLRADERHRAMPIVMVTSRSTARHRELATRAGIDGYLTKPFQEHELLQNVLRLLPAGE